MGFFAWGGEICLNCEYSKNKERFITKQQSRGQWVKIYQEETSSLGGFLLDELNKILAKGRAG